MAKKTFEQQVSNSGSTVKELGNDQSVHWAIPGTNGREVTLDLKVHENPNNKIRVQIYRGNQRVEKFTAKTPIDRSINLKPKSGMVNIRISMITTGGWFGGFLEETVPGMPGVAGRYKIKLDVSTEQSTGVPSGSPESGTESQLLQALLGGEGESGLPMGPIILIAVLLIGAVAFK